METVFNIYLQHEETSERTQALWTSLVPLICITSPGPRREWRWSGLSWRSFSIPLAWRGHKATKAVWFSDHFPGWPSQLPVSFPSPSSLHLSLSLSLMHTNTHPPTTIYTYVYREWLQQAGKTETQWGWALTHLCLPKGKLKPDKETVCASTWAELRDGAKTQKTHFLGEFPWSGKSFLPREGRDRQMLCLSRFLLAKTAYSVG